MRNKKLYEKVAFSIFIFLLILACSRHLLCPEAKKEIKPEVLWSYKTGGGVDSSPSIADIDNDGKLEVVFGSEDGNVYALSTFSKVPSPSLLPWPRFKHDIKNTGLWTGSPNPPW